MSDDFVLDPTIIIRKEQLNKIVALHYKDKPEIEKKDQQNKNQLENEPKFQEIEETELNEEINYPEEILEYQAEITVPESESSLEKEDIDFYPLLNSYYPASEDVDFCTRTDHLLEPDYPNEKHLKQYRNYESGFYSEENIHANYLKAQPACFLILGKPDIGQAELGRKLSEYWKCIYFHPLQLINESKELQEELLKHGGSIEADAILDLVKRKMVEPSVKYRGFVLCGLPLIANDLILDERERFNSDETVNYEDQIDAIFDIFRHLEFTIIYIVCENEDVVINRNKLNDDYRLVLPENFISQITTQVANYTLHMSNIIEHKILQHDIQYVIKLDGRTSIEKMFEILKSKLDYLPLNKVILPEKIDLKQMNLEPKSIQDCFDSVNKREFKEDLVTYSYGWSTWGGRCPVTRKMADFNYPIRFFNRIYFVKNEISRDLFITNPRSYLIPKSNLKVFVYGKDTINKQKLVEALGEYSAGLVVDFNKIETDELNKKIIKLTSDYLKKVRKEAQIVENSRLEEIENWKESCLVYLKQLDEQFAKKNPPIDLNQIAYLRSFPNLESAIEETEITSTLLEEQIGETPNTDSLIISLQEQLQKFNLPLIDYPNLCKLLIENENQLLEYLPFGIKEATDLDPPLPEDFLDDIQLTNNEIKNIYIDNFKKNDAKKWTIANMPDRYEILDNLIPDYLPEEVVFINGYIKDAIEEEEENLEEITEEEENQWLIKQFYLERNQIISINPKRGGLTEICEEVLTTIRSHNLKVSYTVDEEREETSKNDNKHFGDTADYCPVAFTKYFVLAKGKPQFSCEFNNRTYYLTRKESVWKFLDQPEKFLTITKPFEKFPSPRLCILGVKGSGKSTIAKGISQNFGLKLIKIDQAESVLKFWFHPNYKSIGLVLDGFPNSQKDLDYMISNYAIPELIICIKQDLDKYTAIRREIYDKKLEEYGKARSIWKNERSEIYLHLAQLQDSIDGPGDNSNIDEILNRELPEPKFEETWDEAAIAETYNTGIERIQSIKSAAEIELIQWKEIKFNLSLERTIAQAYLFVAPLKFKESIFETCYDISRKIAEILLESGYYFLSQFKRFCPVVYCDESRMLRFPTDSNSIPIVHRSYIYFISNKTNCKTFKANPLKYSTYEMICKIVPFRLALIGPCKAGKSALSKKFGSYNKFTVITKGDAIRYVLDELSEFRLAKQVRGELKKGKPLNDLFLIKCVEAMSYNKSQVLLFDGFPSSLKQTQYLARFGLIPHVIFDLQPLRNLKATYNKLQNLYYNTWLESAENFRLWLNMEYQLIVDYPIEFSIWGSWTALDGLIQNVYMDVLNYHLNALNGLPLSVARMLITPREFVQRQNQKFKSYCPCCLFYINALTSGGVTPNRRRLIQYKDYLYWLCEQHLDDFVGEPEKFLNESNVLPSDLPVIVTGLREMPDNVAENGQCLVCYQNQMIVPGSLEFAVLYKNYIYLFHDSSCLMQFMTNPNGYCYIKINFKNRPNYALIDYKSLPVLGFLEQFVADKIIATLINVGCRRPLIPGLSISQSAMLHIGLLLKMNDKTVPYYRDAFNEYEKRKKKLVEFLKRMKSMINPYLEFPV